MANANYKSLSKRARTPRSSIDHTKLDQSTGYLVRRTYRAFTSSLEQRLKDHGITISIWFFLRLLWERDGLNQKELSDELGLTQPTTVSAMDNMEELGLIERARSTDDRRKVHIFLTKKGRALKERLLPYADKVNRIGLRDLGPEEVRALWDMLERVNRSLDEDLQKFEAADNAISKHMVSSKRRAMMERIRRQP